MQNKNKKVPEHYFSKIFTNDEFTTLVIDKVKCLCGMEITLDNKPRYVKNGIIEMCDFCVKNEVN